MARKRPIDFGEFEKNRDSIRVLSLEFFPHIATFWEPGRQYIDAAIVRPNRATGFAYQATAGQSGPNEPQWPKTLGGVVQDGSITWTAIAADTNGIQSLSSPTVTPTPSAGLTVGAPSVVDGDATSSAVSFSIESGSIGGYDLAVSVAAGSETLIGIVRVTVK